MIIISLSAVVDDQDSATKVVEVCSRVMAGLAFEGFYVSLNLQTAEDENTPAVGAEEPERPS